MNKQCLVLLIFAFFAASCNKSTSRKAIINQAEVMVELTPQTDTLRLSTLFNKWHLVELKGKLIGDIADVQQIDSVLIVRSESDGTNLHLFNDNGTYIRSMVRYGRGNNEVLNLASFTYNPYTETIDVLCNYGAEIWQYERSGVIKNKIKLPETPIFSVADFEALDPHTYLLYKDLGIPDYQGEQHKLYVYDWQKQMVVNNFIPMDAALAEKISISQSNNLYRQNGRIFFYEAFQNGIYECQADGVKPVVGFQVNPFTYPIEMISSCVDEGDFIRKSIESPYIWAHINCVAYEDYVFSYFTYHKQMLLNVIDMEHKMARTYEYVHDDCFSNKTFRSNLFHVISNTDRALVCSYWSPELMASDNSCLLFLSRVE